MSSGPSTESTIQCYLFVVLNHVYLRSILCTTISGSSIWTLLAGASYAVTRLEADLAPYFPSYNGVARDIIGSAIYIATADNRLLLLVVDMS